MHASTSVEIPATAVNIISYAAFGTRNIGPLPMLTTAATATAASAAAAATAARIEPIDGRNFMGALKHEHASRQGPLGRHWNRPSSARAWGGGRSHATGNTSGRNAHTSSGNMASKQGGRGGSGGQGMATEGEGGARSSRPMAMSVGSGLVTGYRLGSGGRGPEPLNYISKPYTNPKAQNPTSYTPHSKLFTLKAETEVLCEQHTILFDTTVGTSSDHLLLARLPSTSKGGPRKVPTLVSKSLICCSHNTNPCILNFKPETPNPKSYSKSMT